MLRIEGLWIRNCGKDNHSYFSSVFLNMCPPHFFLSFSLFQVEKTKWVWQQCSIPREPWPEHYWTETDVMDSGLEAEAHRWIPCDVNLQSTELEHALGSSCEKWETSDNLWKKKKPKYNKNLYSTSVITLLLIYIKPWMLYLIKQLIIIWSWHLFLTEIPKEAFFLCRL